MPPYADPDRSLVVVAGPGAIGGLFAARLARTGRHVVLLCRDPQSADRLNSNGLRVHEINGQQETFSLSATSDTDCAKQADFVLIAVKTYDTPTLLERLAPALTDRAFVATVQNGLGSAAAIAARIGGRRLACAVTAHGALRDEDGILTHTGCGPTRVAPFQPHSPTAARAWTALLQEVGFDVEYAPDRDRVVWNKLALNVGVNAVTALAAVRNGALLDDAALFARARQATIEAVAVARALGVRLDEKKTVAALRQICERTANNFSSMLQDLRRGQTTEIEFLNGAVAREGRRLGVPVPMNEDLAAAVRAREHIGKRKE